MASRSIVYKNMRPLMIFRAFRNHCSSITYKMLLWGIINELAISKNYG